MAGPTQNERAMCRQRLWSSGINCSNAVLTAERALSIAMGMDEPPWDRGRAAREHSRTRRPATKVRCRAGGRMGWDEKTERAAAEGCPAWPDQSEPATVYFNAMGIVI
jgi:hypothetical protein